MLETPIGVKGKREKGKREGRGGTALNMCMGSGMKFTVMTLNNQGRKIILRSVSCLRER